MNNPTTKSKIELESELCHPELRFDATDRRLTECNDWTCDCHEMVREQDHNYGIWHYEWSPTELNDLDQPGMYVRVPGDTN